MEQANNQASLKSTETCHVKTAIPDISVLSDQCCMLYCFNKAADDNEGTEALPLITPGTNTQIFYPG